MSAISTVPAVAEESTLILPALTAIEPVGSASVALDASTPTAPAASAVVAGTPLAPLAGGTLFNRIEQAVTLALESASESSGTPGSSPLSVDVNTAIQNAIESVLNGGQGMSSPSTVNPSATSPDQAAATQALPIAVPPSVPTGIDASAFANSAAQAFFNLLEQKGVDPEHFQADFQAAFQHASNGAAIVPALITPSSLAGSFIDTTG